MAELLFSPSGRIGRGKWWLGQLYLILSLGTIVCLWVYASTQPKETLGILGVPLLLLTIVIIPLNFWNNLVITIKRYHDRNKSGWWFLFIFVPIVGPIWQLIELGFLGGDLGENDYGDGPGYDISSEINQLSGFAPVQGKALATPAKSAPSQPRSNFGQSPKPMFGGRT